MSKGKGLIFFISAIFFITFIMFWINGEKISYVYYDNINEPTVKIDGFYVHFGSSENDSFESDYVHSGEQSYKFIESESLYLKFDKPLKDIVDTSHITNGEIIFTDVLNSHLSDDSYVVLNLTYKGVMDYTDVNINTLEGYNESLFKYTKINIVGYKVVPGSDLLQTRDVVLYYSLSEPVDMFKNFERLSLKMRANSSTLEDDWFYMNFNIQASGIDWVIEFFRQLIKPIQNLCFWVGASLPNYWDMILHFNIPRVNSF